jgi:hypothetical protein
MLSRHREAIDAMRPHQVTRTKEAVGSEGRARCLGIGKVAGHGAGTAETELANFAKCHLRLLPGIEQPNLIAGRYRIADGLVTQRSGRRRGGSEDHALRHAEHLTNRDTDMRLDCFGSREREKLL